MSLRILGITAMADSGQIMQGRGMSFRQIKRSIVIEMNGLAGWDDAMLRYSSSLRCMQHILFLSLTSRLTFLHQVNLPNLDKLIGVMIANSKDEFKPKGV